MTSYTVLITIGFQGAGKRQPGQLVQAIIVFSGGGGEEKISFDAAGKYINDPADAKIRRRSWKIVRRAISPGDSIRFEVYTGVRGAGEDSSLTGSWLYVLDPSAPIQAFAIPNVGPKGYPLAKGRLRELAATTRRDQLDDDLQQFVDNEEGM